MSARYFCTLIFCLFGLNACGGGGGGGGDNNSNSNSNPPIKTPSITARILANNTVKLVLANVGTSSGRYCIRQDAATPVASDTCFTDTNSSSLTQEHTIASPSSTQRVTFTAWALEGNTIRRLASLSLPGRTCSQAAYDSLNAASTNLPAVCILTGTSTALQESILLLESVKARISTENFLRYVNQGFYDQTVFHRFLKGNLGVVQGGGFTHDGTAYVTKTATLSPIVLESTLQTGLKNTAGTISMARTTAPDSATAGFFVNTIDNSSFDSTNLRDGYAVFGRFIYGASNWTALLNSVSSSTTEIINPTPPVRLHWAYQIQ